MNIHACLNLLKSRMGRFHLPFLSENNVDTIEIGLSSNHNAIDRTFGACRLMKVFNKSDIEERSLMEMLSTHALPTLVSKAVSDK